MCSEMFDVNFNVSKVTICQGIPNFESVERSERISEYTDTNNLFIEILSDVGGGGD